MDNLIVTIREIQTLYVFIENAKRCQLNYKTLGINDFVNGIKFFFFLIFQTFISHDAHFTHIMFFLNYNLIVGGRRFEHGCLFLIGTQ